MGIDWGTTLFLGIRIPTQKVFIQKTKIVNGCACRPKTSPKEYPEAIYCPKCGLPLREEKLHEICLFGYYDKLYE